VVEKFFSELASQFASFHSGSTSQAASPYGTRVSCNGEAFPTDTACAYAWGEQGDTGPRSRFPSVQRAQWESAVGVPSAGALNCVVDSDTGPTAIWDMTNRLGFLSRNPHPTIDARGLGVSLRFAESAAASRETDPATGAAPRGVIAGISHRRLWGSPWRRHSCQALLPAAFPLMGTLLV
jgi:hypothetical protein